MIQNHGEGIRPGIVWDDGEWLPIWQYRFLFDALYLRVFLDMQAGKTFRRCIKKRCRKFFLSTHPDNQYCSETCPTAHLVPMHREREWKDKLLQKYKKTDQDWLSKQIEYLLKQGISGANKYLNPGCTRPWAI